VAPGGEDGAARWSLQASGSLGAWRLAVRVPRQAVWKLAALREQCQAMLMQQMWFVLTWMCVVYKASMIP